MPEFSEQSEELAPKSEKPAEEPAPQPEDTAALEPQPTEEVALEQEEKEEIQLSKPSKELAIRILTRVSFQERLIGYKMMATTGNLEESIYSFKDAIDLLWFDVGELGVRTSGSIGYIDPVKLERWVGETLGDKELADAIGKKVKEYSNYREQVESIKPLMKQRLRQCQEIARGKQGLED